MSNATYKGHPRSDVVCPKHAADNAAGKTYACANLKKIDISPTLSRCECDCGVMFHIDTAWLREFAA